MRCLLEDETSRNDIEALSEFYGDLNSADIVHKRELLFARFKKLHCLFSVTKITEDMRQNQVFADMAPKFVCVLKT